jgi:hypothetical protein
VTYPTKKSIFFLNRDVKKKMAEFSLFFTFFVRSLFAILDWSADSGPNRGRAEVGALARLANMDFLASLAASSIPPSLAHECVFPAGVGGSS